MLERIAATGTNAFVATGADLLEHRIEGAIQRHGSCVIGLSGGSTPGPIYAALGKKNDIDWSVVHVFLVDDRCVPPDHEHSNQKLIRETLLSTAIIPAQNLFFPNTELSPAECAAEYGQRLSALFAVHPFDISVLGMGPDGHIASLFPPLQDEAFAPAIALPAVTDRFDVRDRISVSLPVLTKAAWSLFLIKGAEKKAVWTTMEESTEGPKIWPAKAILDATPSTVLTD